MPPPPKAKPKEEEEGAKAEEGKKEEKAEEGKKEAGKEAPMKEEGGEKKAAEEKKGEGKEEGKEEKKESKEGKAPSEKAMMQKLSEAANAINAARESKDWDTTKAKADEVAELAKMAAGMEGQQEDKAGWYNALAEGASELSAAAGEKKLPDAMAAMKKVGETCKPCHEKYKK
jgi:Zn-dependent M32 family carboxypeptidase